MSVHQGVSILLLDYILVSALLMVTDVQEWMLVRKYDGQSSPTSPLASSGSMSATPPRTSTSSTSDRQLRKILFGEPIFPKRMSTMSSRASTSTASHVPPTPTSAGQWNKIMFGKPLYPSLRPHSSDSSFSDSESEEEVSESESDVQTDDDGRSEDVTGVKVAKEPQRPSRPPSPSSESVFYPLTPASAPSHTYLDPLFYNEFNIPPVPKIPAKYASSASPSPITPGSASTSRRFRELPRPPSHRSQSTPRPRTTESLPSPVESNISSISDERRRPSYDAAFLSSPTSSSYQRTLPVPPPQSPIDPRVPSLPLRHSSSSGRPLNARYKHQSQFSGRTLPPTPTERRAEKSYGGLADWLSRPDWDSPRASTSAARPESILSIDCPPPAYNTIDFSSGPGIPPMWPNTSDPPQPQPPPPLTATTSGTIV